MTGHKKKPLFERHKKRAVIFNYQLYHAFVTFIVGTDRCVIEPDP